MVKTIAGYEQLNCSVWGNPRFKVDFTDGESLLTSSDTPASYDVRNNVGKTVVLTLTRAGRITNIREVK